MGISLIKGIITGIILSLPFGPVGLYCIELTMLEGRWKGYVTALGMVTIDVLYSLISLIFLSNVEDFVIRYENILSFLIGIILTYYSLKKLLNRIIIKKVDVEYKNIVQSYFAGILFALANITSILIITGIFTFLKVIKDESPIQVYEVLLGVLIGGAGLWFFTTSLTSHYGNKLTEDKLILTIKGVNTVLLIFSLILIIKAIIKF